MIKKLATASALGLICLMGAGCVSETGSYVAYDSGLRYERVEPGYRNYHRWDRDRRDRYERHYSRRDDDRRRRYDGRDRRRDSDSRSRPDRPDRDVNARDDYRGSELRRLIWQSERK
ncbi:hypothetical protein REJC140_02775 [Pseudorhizobium endolithicum]|uniref:Lipoprotein n=1 Tax=Pseudorhizobium endolithicum TaxID=1191678 RepID=A0ABM8PH67_9HYPH|nr:hypothetical protein REJC140_02775 [Pseudorhizobium endolithicum]